MVSKDASMHTSSLKVKLFVLHYHDSEEASKKQVCVRERERERVGRRGGARSTLCHSTFRRCCTELQ